MRCRDLLPRQGSLTRRSALTGGQFYLKDSFAAGRHLKVLIRGKSFRLGHNSAVQRPRRPIHLLDLYFSTKPSAPSFPIILESIPTLLLTVFFATRASR